MSHQYTLRAVELGFDFDTPHKNDKLEIIYLLPLDLPVDETVHEIVAKVKKIAGQSPFRSTDKSAECCW